MLYQRLDNSQNLTRLLHLHPAIDPEDEIKCQFAIVSLDDDPQYEALSYVWGDIKNMRAVIVDGHHVSITSNLHSALVHLRLPNQERVLWVDALCINQVDLDERTHQVSRMGSIYGQASRVVVWLGKGWDGSEIAMEVLCKLGDDANLHLDTALTPCIDVRGLNFASLDLCGQLIRLFELPWWKRVWTVQEFILAKDLIFQCSRSLVTGKQMYMARENFWSHRDRCCQTRDLDYPHPKYGVSLGHAFTMPAKLDFVNKARGQDGSYSVLLAMATFSDREVTDPKDRVYGTLALGTDEYAGIISPDYTLSPEDISESVAINSVRRTGKLEFLSHLFEHHNQSLPSWVPNWTGEYSWASIYANRLGNLRFFNASLGTMAELKVISKGKIALKGVFFDKIKDVGSLVGESAYLHPKYLEELRILTGLNVPSEEQYCHTDDSCQIALWHTVCGGVEMYLQDPGVHKTKEKAILKPV